jgi:hypothetical protein
MAITINLFSQAFIDGMLSVLKPPTTFLRDRFWVGSPELHEIDAIMVDVEVEGQKIAALVSSEDNPIKVGRTGYTTNQVKTPKILMIVDLKPRDFIDPRQPGQAGITNTSDPKFRARVEDELGKLLKKFIDMRVRMEEWMCAQALLFGKWTVTLPDSKKYSIDFKRPAGHTYTLTGAEKWDAPTTADPAGIIDTKSALIVRGSGIQPNTVVMNKVTKQLMFACDKWKKMFDSPKNLFRGVVDTTASLMQAGAKKFAEIDNIEYFEYDATYEDFDGTTKLYVPDNYVIVGGPHLGNKKHYGPIEDFDAMPDIRKLEFSKNWIEKMPSKWNLSYESHPLLAQHKPECALSLKVA